MQNKILIIHGWGGSDYPHWQSWLAGKLASEYGTVSFPLLDNPHFPSKNRWIKQIKEIIDDFSPNIIIAHSLGSVLWLWVANELDIALDKVILVAPPSQKTTIETIKTFFPYPTPPSNAKETIIIASDNDPYITPQEIKLLGAQIDSKVTIFPQMGHINADSGFGQWDYMYELVQKKKGISNDSKH